MSAIAGILYHRQRDTSSDPIALVTKAMRSRGPDHEGHWRGAQVVLGHCMLRATPEALVERCPLTSSDGRHVLVWDGRLDNRDEIRLALKANMVLPRNECDAELVLCGLGLWGERAVERLLGDFAFAVWDVERRYLFCARDHVGGSPFYYVNTAEFFAFASEDEALLQLPGVSPEPNEDRIAYALVPSLDAYDYSVSWLKDVRSLMPAHTITASVGKVSDPQRYWTPKPSNLGLRVDADYDEAFRALFNDAVRCRLRSIAGPAMMLSGGLDSAAIVAAFAQNQRLHQSTGLETFSAVSDDVAQCTESRSILQLIQWHELSANFLNVPSFTGMLNTADLNFVADYRAHPVDNSILLPSMMYLAAQRAGFRVMLHGTSGDLTTYTRDPYPAYLLRSGRWLDAWKESIAASRNHTALQSLSPMQIFGRSALNAFGSRNLDWLRRPYRFFRRRELMDLSSLNAAFVSKLRLKQRLRERDESRGNRHVSLADDHRDAIIPVGIVRGLDGHSRLCGKYGIEHRDPWADRRLIEFFLSLPLEQRTRDGWTKLPVRRAYRDELPELVRSRKDKQHLGYHFQRRLYTQYSHDQEAEARACLRHLKTYLSESELERVTTTPFPNLDPDVLSDRMALAQWLTRLGNG